jgi:SAM-dependent methyltransferase
MGMWNHVAMGAERTPGYRADLALIHHEGFAFHAEDCAPGILSLLESVRPRHGLVVELGCGSGLLTKHLVDAGHRVIATDASPPMLDIAREYAGAAQEIRRLTSPDDPIPHADAIVSVGHVVNYLADADAIERALVAMAEALQPGGLLAIDLCDLSYAEARSAPSTGGWVADDWAIITERSVPSSDRFVRQMAIFMKNEDGSWRRDDERHDKVLIDTSSVPELLSRHGVRADVGQAFGKERLPEGLRTLIGRREA